MNKKRLLVVEPYGSYVGHPVKNADIFSDKNMINHYNYEFYGDKGLKNKCIRKFFFDTSKFYNLNYNEMVKVKKREFHKLILDTKNSYILFTTMHEWDMEALLILTKKGLKKTLEENNNILIIHSAFGMYSIFLKYANILNREFIGNNIKFSFFSEIQTYLMKQLYKNLDFYSLYFPVYHKETENKSYKNPKNKFISYLGVFSLYKNPFFLVDLIKQINSVKFLIQFYKIDESNFLLAKRFSGENNHKVVFNKISEKDYKKILGETKFGILPYDQYEYSARASGIFEEYLINGIPAFVPENTWMSYIAKKKNLIETVYDGSKEDFLEKFEFAYKNYDEILEKWKIESKKSLNERSFKTFFNKINRIFIGDNIEENIDVLNSKKILGNGMINYYVRSAFFFYDRGEIEQAEKVLSQVKSAPKNYADYYYIKRLLNGNSLNKEISYYTFFTTNNRKTDPRKDYYRFSLYSLIKSGNAEVILKEFNTPDMRIFFRLLKKEIPLKYYNEVYRLYLYYFSETALFLNSKKIKSDLVKKLDVFFGENKLFLSAIDLFYISKSYFLLEEYKKAYEIFKIVNLDGNINMKLRKEIYCYLRKLFTKILDITNKTDLEIQYISNEILRYKKNINNYCDTNEIHLLLYKLASIYQRKKLYGKSKNIFKKLLNEPKLSRELISGVYFHLGEIELELNHEKQALKYFEKCVKLNPEHKKAKKYLMDLTEYKTEIK